MATRAAPQLGPEQLGELLGLLEGADSAELKLTVAEGARYAALEALGVDPLDARIRQVYFFDTPELTLNGAGIVVRARRIQDTAVVKLRPIVPSELPSDLRANPSLVVEVDAMPGGFVCSASMKGASTNEAILDVAHANIPIKKLYSKQQRSFFKMHAPEGIALEELSTLGPITVLKLKLRPTGFARKLAVELWMYPDGSRILELSTKCAPSEAFHVSAQAQAYLGGIHLDLSGAQQTKTATALRFFAKRLSENSGN
jgi:hypothetical protein